MTTPTVNFLPDATIATLDTQELNSYKGKLVQFIQTETQRNIAAFGPGTGFFTGNQFQTAGGMALRIITGGWSPNAQGLAIYKDETEASKILGGSDIGWSAESRKAAGQLAKINKILQQHKQEASEKEATAQLENERTQRVLSGERAPSSIADHYAKWVNIFKESTARENDKTWTDAQLQYLNGLNAEITRQIVQYGLIDNRWKKDFGIA